MEHAHSTTAHKEHTAPLSTSLCHWRSMECVLCETQTSEQSLYLRADGGGFF